MFKTVNMNMKYMDGNFVMMEKILHLNFVENKNDKTMSQ